MLDLIIEVTTFFMPGYLVNVLMYLFWLRIGLGIPVDLNYNLGNARIIGDSRGLNSILIASFIMYAYCLMVNRTDYEQLTVGYVLGTNLSSFIKRRLSIERGQFSLLDQNDYVVGILVVSSFTQDFKVRFIVCSLILGFILHLCINKGRFLCERFIKRKILS